MARIDDRDVLSCAEYPRITGAGWGTSLSEAERQKLYDEDWREYEEWLNRP